jgi:hypothetical protein
MYGRTGGLPIARTTLLTRARNFVRRRLRGAQRGGQFPILLPHHRVAGTTLRSADGSEHALAPALAAAAPILAPAK